ncbi:hypothetical protein FKM82_011108 [Ascaphus truei]
MLLWKSIFSLMGNIWTDERNRMSVNLVKAEICTQVNYNMTCQEFLTYVGDPEQTDLLKSVMGNSKYSFKFKGNIENYTGWGESNLAHPSVSFV